jgi:hypothetical protein
LQVFKNVFTKNLYKENGRARNTAQVVEGLIQTPISPPKKRNIFSINNIKQNAERTLGS